MALYKFRIIIIIIIISSSPSLRVGAYILKIGNLGRCRVPLSKCMDEF